MLDSDDMLLQLNAVEVIGYSSHLLVLFYYSQA